MKDEEIYYIPGSDECCDSDCKYDYAKCMEIENGCRGYAPSEYKEEGDAKSDGGCAFPVIGGNSQSFGPYGAGETVTAGMSLRDYFAAKAMQGLLGSLDITKPILWDKKEISIPELSYMLSDAMLKEKNK